FDQEVRRADRQRQLRQGGRGAQRRLDAGRETRRHRTRDQGCGRRHGNRCTVSARIHRQGGLRLLALLLNGGGWLVFRWTRKLTGNDLLTPGFNLQFFHGNNPQAEYPLWVKSRHQRVSKKCPLYPRKRTLVERVGM